MCRLYGKVCILCKMRRIFLHINGPSISSLVNIQRVLSEDEFPTVISNRFFLNRVWFHISRFIPGFPEYEGLHDFRCFAEKTILPSTEATELDKLHVFLRLVPNACFPRLCHSLQVSRHSHTLNVLQRLVPWYVFPRSGFATSFLVLCISYMFSLENDPFVHVYITLIYSYWVELQTTYLDHTFSFVHLAPKTNQ